MARRRNPLARGTRTRGWSRPAVERPAKNLNGVLWVLRTGAPWKDLPPRYGSYQTVHRRFQNWVRSGVLELVLLAIAQDLKDRGGLDVSECFIAGTKVPSIKHSLTSAELVGQMTRPYDIITHGCQTYFGVKFFPHSFSMFTRESIHDLRDQSIHLPEILLADITPVIDAINENPGFEIFTELMETYFIGVLARMSVSDKAYKTVDRAVRHLFTQKAFSRIEQLYRDLGVSERYLQNVFRLHVGLTPKQLLRMIRFQTSFQYLYNHYLSLTDIALQCGYYDHAHFTHEFNTFAGLTPSVFRSMHNPFNRFFLDKSNLAYLCDYKN